APDAAVRERLEHALVGIVDVDEEFSAGRFAELARGIIDAALVAGRTPIVVGGTGLYMRAALADLDLRPPVPAAVRAEVEALVAARGPAAAHAELEPDVAARIHRNDRKRIARALELQRVGIDPPGRGRRLWTARLRHPTVLAGIVADRTELAERIDRRVEAMVAAGAAAAARAALAAGASRTARAALGLEELLAGDAAAAKAAHRRYARRQVGWMRRMAGVETIDRSGRSDRETAAAILALLDRGPGGAPGAG
ncbi:MAG: tRNA (adenosine(37)-N6)-dimethylallyltransferase MiaA, partial [Thermoleophilia bacterium]|nr:tRNA (adenosine(37)-N6)-dimethylallyltransferase MiaA [Thermoleophilia bacterium]